MWPDGSRARAATPWSCGRGTTPPDEYAAIWIEQEDAGGDFETSFAAWIDYYARLGVESIDSGIVTMRRSSTATSWFRVEDSPDTMSFPAGDDLARRFDAEDFLAAHAADDALLATRFRLAGDVRLNQQFGAGEGGWTLLANVVRRTQGLHWSGSVDLGGASLLGQCDGTRTMASLLDDLAASVGPEAAELRASWPATVRRLVECGFLAPA